MTPDAAETPAERIIFDKYTLEAIDGDVLIDLHHKYSLPYIRDRANIGRSEGSRFGVNTLKHRFYDLVMKIVSESDRKTRAEVLEDLNGPKKNKISLPTASKKVAEKASPRKAGRKVLKKASKKSQKTKALAKDGGEWISYKPLAAKPSSGRKTRSAVRDQRKKNVKEALSIESDPALVKEPRSMFVETLVEQEMMRYRAEQKYDESAEPFDPTPVNEIVDGHIWRPTI